MNQEPKSWTMFDYYKLYKSEGGLTCDAYEDARITWLDLNGYPEYTPTIA